MDFPLHTIMYVGDLLKNPPDLLLIQMTSVCLGKDSIRDEWSFLIEPGVINQQTSEWEEGAECSGTTPPGYQDEEWGEMASERRGFCPHRCTGDLWKGGLRYRQETLKDKKERLPNAVWLMGLRCGTHQGSALRRGKGWRLVFASFVLATQLAPRHKAGLAGHARGDFCKQKGLERCLHVWTLWTALFTWSSVVRMAWYTET